jgi:hypothetical protein
MVDYFSVFLNGIATGMGVLMAQSIYNSFKKYREHMKNGAKKMIQTGLQYGKVPVRRLDEKCYDERHEDDRDIRHDFFYLQ